ncbi:MAG: hypothetical protein ACLT98_13820 [Eggerthellaceae bacterium]
MTFEMASAACATDAAECDVVAAFATGVEGLQELAAYGTDRTSSCRRPRSVCDAGRGGSLVDLVREHEPAVVMFSCRRSERGAAWRSARRRLRSRNRRGRRSPPRRGARGLSRKVLETVAVAHGVPTILTVRPGRSRPRRCARRKRS